VFVVPPPPPPPPPLFFSLFFILLIYVGAWRGCRGRGAPPPPPPEVSLMIARRSVSFTRASRRCTGDAAKLLSQLVIRQTNFNPRESVAG
jgi:hypothetical protein